MMLNYKRMPFQTEWCEYAELEPKLKALYASWTVGTISRKLLM